LILKKYFFLENVIRKNKNECLVIGCTDNTYRKGISKYKAYLCEAHCKKLEAEKKRIFKLMNIKCCVEECDYLARYGSSYCGAHSHIQERPEDGHTKKTFDKSFSAIINMDKVKNIVNLKSGFYVGKCRRPNGRFSTHIKNFGCDSLEMTLVFVGNQSEALQMESKLINHYLNKSPPVNITNIATENPGTLSNYNEDDYYTYIIHDPRGIITPKISSEKIIGKKSTAEINEYVELAANNIKKMVKTNNLNFKIGRTSNRKDRRIAYNKTKQFKQITDIEEFTVLLVPNNQDFNSVDLSEIEHLLIKKFKYDKEFSHRLSNRSFGHDGLTSEDPNEYAIYCVFELPRDEEADIPETELQKDKTIKIEIKKENGKKKYEEFKVEKNKYNNIDYITTFPIHKIASILSINLKKDESLTKSKF
jgi:hypothetical protein